MRKFKTEILMSSDKKDREEVKVRKSQIMEPPRWRLNLIESSVKRKYTCENELSTTRSENKTYTQKTGLTFLKPKSKVSIQQPSESEISTYTKVLETFIKRPLSDNKNGSLTPQQYQSLQSFDLKSTPSILHPSVTKKSPNILQSIHNTSIKGTFNQVPLVTAPRSLAKKLERKGGNNMLINIEPLNLGQSHLPWMHSSRRKESKKDEFTLPNLPGAASSPQKPKLKKLSPVNTVTPRVLSSSSQKNGPSKNLPHM